jgi:hypothetical protein
VTKEIRRRPFENLTQEEELDEEIQEESEKTPVGSADVIEPDQEPAKTFQHGNIFDHKPFAGSPSEASKMVLKRLKDEGF